MMQEIELVFLKNDPADAKNVTYSQVQKWPCSKYSCIHSHNGAGHTVLIMVGTLGYHHLANPLSAAER
jgi:hypothetical protein